MGCSDSKPTHTVTEEPAHHHPPVPLSQRNNGAAPQTNNNGNGIKKPPLRPKGPEFSRDPYTEEPVPNPAPPPAPPARPPMLTPDDRKFTVSTNGRNGYKVADVYSSAKQELGKGTFGSVYKANHLKSDPNRPHEWNRVAVKLTSPTILDKRSGQLATYDHIEKHCQEIKTLLRLREGQNFRSSSVLFLFEYFWTYRTDGKGELVLVTELLGQELDQWRQQQVVFHESSARSISATLVSALEFMHERQVVHRDLKLQNVLFRKNGDYRSLKIVDFGLAKVLDGSLANDFCGSLGYISPEMYLNKPYSYEVDMFAMGVIIFRLLSGIRPFASTNSDKLKSDTVNLRYKIQGKVWENVSPEALKLVRKLLIGREERLTAVQAVDHEWFNVQEESVLNADYGQTQGFNAADGYSQPIVQSQAPEDPHVSTANANRFWLDGKLDLAVNILLSYNLYVGRIIESSKEEQGELIFLEEIPHPSMRTLPAYVARLPSYTERECRRICREAAQIVQILHNAKMAHRNIHMNNFVVDKNEKLLVRGLSNAQAVEEDQPLTGHFGYLYSWYAFKAPEIDNDFFHDKTVDIWSLGAFIYMMLTALPPFRGDGADLIANKHNGNVVFDTVLPSGAAQRLVRSLLQVNPADRPTIEQVLDAEWMIEADDVLGNYDLTLAKTFLSDWEHRPTVR